MRDGHDSGVLEVVEQSPLLSSRRFSLVRYFTASSVTFIRSSLLTESLEQAKLCPLFCFLSLHSLAKFKKTNVSRPDFYKKRERAGGRLFLLFPTFLLFPIEFFPALHIITLPQI